MKMIPSRDLRQRRSMESSESSSSSYRNSNCSHEKGQHQRRDRDTSYRSRSSRGSDLSHSDMLEEPKLEQNHKFYGDIVNSAMLGIAFPFMIVRMYDEEDLDNWDAIVMASATFLSAVFMGLAWMYDSLACSRLGFLGNCFAGSHMELKEWPLKGVCTISSRFMGGVLIHCFANVSLSVQEQVMRLTAIFVIGSYVSIRSPYSVYTEDALPYLGGSVMAAFLALYLIHNSANIRKTLDGSPITKTSRGLFNIQIQRDEFIVHLARAVLAAMYTHHAFAIINDLMNYDATSEEIFALFFDLTKVSIIAAVGSVATGVFKTNIDQKEQLEVMVRERTTEIRFKNIQLNRINIAFDACKTAIAITDASRTVIWTNPAFESLAKRTQEHCGSKDTATLESSIDQELTDAVVLDDPSNETKLRGAFDFSYPRQDEIEILDGDGKSQYRLEVTPFTDDLEDVQFLEDERMQATAFAFEPATSGGRRGSGSGRRGSFTANSHKLFLVAFNDITADRAREEAEQNAREESLLSKAMKESMVTLTHELRTPLQGIMGITSLMLEQQEMEHNSSTVKENAESLGLIMGSSSLLLNLINNLLDVKKATANMMDEFLLAPLLAADPIRDAIDFCNPLASISNVKISMDCCDDTDEAFVTANDLRLQQVLINMISNAIKYTDQGTDITVRTRASTVGETMVALRKSIASSSDWEDPASYVPPESSPVLVFSVSDAGPGIAMNQARRLFQRFARLSQPTRTLGKNAVGQPSGTGLGLHLCQMFVMRMRGSIWAENNAERGSTFSFCLPLVGSPEEPLEDDAFVSVSQVPRSPMRKRASMRGGFFPPSMDYRKLRVLVVDDTLINRKVLDRMLKKIGIVKVTTVESGKDALDELFSSGNTYDLVITDLQMPEMSGTELTEAIVQRQDEMEDLDPPEDLLTTFSRRLVVVGLTADTTPGIAERCASSGMSDLLYKPITLVEIKDYFQTKVGRLQPGQWYQNDMRMSAQ